MGELTALGFFVAQLIQQHNRINKWLCGQDRLNRLARIRDVMKESRSNAPTAIKLRKENIVTINHLQVN